jgi:integrase
MARVRLNDRSLKRKAPEKGTLELWDTYLPGLCLRIGYGGRRTFSVMIRIHGNQVRRTIGTYPAMSLAEAHEKAREVIRDAARGIDPKQREAEEKREAERQRLNTFGAAAEKFMEDHASKLRTSKEYQRKLDKDLLPEWGSRPIQEITRAEIKDLIRRKARNSPVAANRLLALISKFFVWAWDEELIDSSPAVGIARPGEEEERERSLTDTEISKVWAAFDRLEYPFGPLFKMLLLTAQRRGEVAGMRWSEIEDGWWRIPKNRSKSRKGHTVSLPDMARDILNDLPRIDGGDLVFSSGRVGDNELSGWSKIKRRCDGLAPEVDDWHIHDLRRTAATGMRSLGVDRLIVSKVLNHAEAGITKTYDRYAADPEKGQALQRWSEYVRNIVDPGVGSGKVVKLGSRH